MRTQVWKQIMFTISGDIFWHTNSRFYLFVDLPSLFLIETSLSPINHIVWILNDNQNVPNQKQYITNCDGHFYQHLWRMNSNI